MNNKELLEALKSAHSKIKRNDSIDTEPVVSGSTESRVPLGKKEMFSPSVTCSLSEKVFRKLRKMGGSDWSPEQILESLVNDFFDVFPEIKLGDDVLCSEMVYRRLKREGDTLLIDNGETHYRLISKKTGERYRSWVNYYKKKGAVDPAQESGGMCIYELEAYLQDFADYRDSGWVKIINPEQYALVK